MTIKRNVILFLLISLLVGFLSKTIDLSKFHGTPEKNTLNPREDESSILTALSTDIKTLELQNSPKINPDLIWSHLENIVGERYTEYYREFTRNYLVEQLQNFGFYPSFQTFENGINIVAKRPQDEPQTPTVLIAAHYDTVANSPGADDNGSGIAVLLEIARLLGSKPTENSLEIVFFDREELGLLGSLDFTSRPENLDDLRDVIVLDMVGYACRVEGCQQYPPGLNVEPLLQANGIASPSKGEFLVVVGEVQHRDLLAAFSGTSSNLDSSNSPSVVPLPIPLKGMLTPDVLRSDHAPFWYQNVAAVLVTDTANLRSPYYHQPSDTLAHLDREFLMGSAQVIVNVVNQLLDAKI
ncbi:MAG: M28 family peptidase [Cyanobacteria bacterium J06592_8]